MNELLKIDFEKQTISARELHGKLTIATRFNDWFPRMCEYGFEEGKDFCSKMSKTSEQGGRPATDYDITMDMAKEICMIQRTPEGKKVREYLIQLERAWNTPELVIARGLQASQRLLKESQEKIKLLEVENERMKPKEIFADAVTASDSTILIRDLAKILRQNGAKYGEKRLYKKLREDGYICKGSTEPTQKAMELGLFERIIRTVQRADALPLETVTTKVTGKGQQYFINKYL